MFVGTRVSTIAAAELTDTWQTVASGDTGTWHACVVQTNSQHVRVRLVVDTVPVFELTLQELSNLLGSTSTFPLRTGAGNTLIYEPRALIRVNTDWTLEAKESTAGGTKRIVSGLVEWGVR